MPQRFYDKIKNAAGTARGGGKNADKDTGQTAMARPDASQDEFVDLYDVLEIPEQADGEEIRKRINVLYIEAQQNLDHRNIKKRMQFQQMYEIYLPQARHLLMDDARRAEYNRYLQAFRTGQKVDASSSDTHTPVRSSKPGVIEGELGGTPDRHSGGLPELIETVDPEQLAVEREAMWAKWKTGLEAITDDAPEPPITSLSNSANYSLSSQSTGDGANATTANASAANAPAAGASTTSSASSATAPGGAGAARARPAQVVPRFQPPAPGGTRHPPGGTPSAPAARPSSVQAGASPGMARPGAAASAEAVNPTGSIEKQREQQRYTLIKDSVQNAGLLWGAGTAAAVFLVGCMLLFVIDNSVKNYPFKMSHSLFIGLCFLMVVFVSIMGGLFARKRAKRRAVAELSVLSIEELMRRTR
jgi:hypothetical protein